METQILEPGSPTETAAPESNARSTQLVVETPSEPRPLTRAENSKAAVRNQVLVAAAWGIMILASILPEVIALEILHAPQALPVITWGRNIALALVVALCAAWEPLRKLWKFPAILLVFTLAQQGMTALSGTGVWREALSNIGDPFTRSYFGTQMWKLGGTLIVIAALAVFGFRRKDAYLVRGDIRAPIRPERWMGSPKPEPWTSFGGKWLVFLSLGMVAILSLFGSLNVGALGAALPLMPIILLLAGLNSFSEEVTYRSAQLAPLVPAVGLRQAWWITAVLFGTMHFYGVPYGIGGVILATFMGWFLGKAMLETRGLFWPWVIHLSQDILIFWFIAAGMVQPGG